MFGLPWWIVLGIGGGALYLLTKKGTGTPAAPSADPNAASSAGGYTAQDVVNAVRAANPGASVDAYLLGDGSVQVTLNCTDPESGEVDSNSRTYPTPAAAISAAPSELKCGSVGRFGEYVRR